MKIDSNNQNEDSVEELIQDCCAILDLSLDLTADAAEFTQGVLSLYHLVRFSISVEQPEISIMLSKTFLTCLRKMDKSIKDIESIAANFFVQVWNFANKVKSDLTNIYRSVALTILVHGGNTYWNRVIDKMVSAVQEASESSFVLVGSVFDEFIYYCSTHSCSGSQCIKSLVQVWIYVVMLSKPSNQHEDRTSKLRLITQDIQNSKQLLWLVELVLSLFGTSEKEIDTSSKKLNDCFTQDMEVILVRIVILSLNITGTAQSQLNDAKSDRKNQFISTVSILLHFSEEIEHFAAITEEMQMKPISLKAKCLTRACSLSYQLLKIDPSKMCICQTVFNHVDNFQKQGINGKKDISTFCSFLSAAGKVTRHNFKTTMLV